MQQLALVLALALAVPVAARTHDHKRPVKISRRTETPAPPVAVRPSAPPPEAVREPHTLDALAAFLRDRFGDPARRREMLRVHPLEAYPLIIVHERFDFETTFFARRLYDRVDYRFSHDTGHAYTLDGGGRSAPDPDLIYEEDEPELCVADSPEGPIAIARSLPDPPLKSRERNIPYPPNPIPPDVVLGRIGRDGWIAPAAQFPSVQAGWRYAFDPYSGRVTRVHRGRFFGPPDAHSPDQRLVPEAALVIRDADGRPLCGAHLAIAHIPGEPEGVLVVEHGGLRIPVGTSGPREREMTAELRTYPGEPVNCRTVQFPVQVFRPDGAVLEPDGLRLLPRNLP